jgi:ArsR family transcriptional regulator, arsenate/arsenite/antimonite-responsive transcriptional repressor
MLVTLMTVDMATTAIKAEMLVEQLKALADPNRLRILEMLKEKGCCSIEANEGMCACDIEGRLELSQPTVSHHMRVLKEAGLVDARKVGQWMWYRRNEAALRHLALAIGK